MADFVCKCGAYIRAYVAPGGSVTCTQCGEILSNGRTADSSADGGSAQTKRSKASLLRKAILPAVATTALLAGGGLAYKLWINAPRNLSPSPVVKDPQANNTDLPKSRPENPAKWSSTLNWNASIADIPKGPEIQQLAVEFVAAEIFTNPTVFWSKLDAGAFAKESPNFNAATLAQFLGNAGQEILSGQKDSICSNWTVLGLHHSQQQTGVLVRYFHEPLTADINQTGDWIDRCRNIVSIDEFESITPGVFSKPIDRSTPTESTASSTEENAEAHLMYFTPYFGYLILLFEVDSDRIVWKDILSLPGEAPISRASAWNDSAKKNIASAEVANLFIDIFGEYQAMSDVPVSQQLYFGTSEAEVQTPVQINRIIETVSQIRSRRLIEVAEAAIRDPGMLSSRVIRFRKDFPDDLGADALLISIWCSGQRSKRNAASYDDSGRVMVDAAHRLYMKTSDPLLLEIKSRIYQSYGRRQDADKSLADAEQSSHRSFFAFERRIQETVEANDKERLKEHLKELNEFILNLPQSAINPEVQSQWNSRLNDWRTATQSK